MSPARHIRVLLVEDDPDDAEEARDLVRAATRDAGAAVEWVATWDEAKTRLLANAHDLCLLDFSLGGQDGPELAQCVLDGGCAVPIVFLTGFSDEESERAALAAGAVDFLVKGEIDPPVLRRAIRHAIEKGRLLAELREGARQVRAVLNASHDALLLVDEDGGFVDANPATSALTGLSRAELQAVRWPDHVDPARRDDARAMWTRMRRLGTHEGELTLLRPDGERRTVELRGTAGVQPGRHLLALRDITEKRRLESQIAITDRLASMGLLAAGVAHEINNPLAVVMGNLEVVTAEIGRATGDPIARATAGDALDDVKAACVLIRDVVRDLRLFSRPEEATASSVDVHPLVNSALRMAWNEVRHRARIVRDLGAVPRARASETHLGQVLLNLVLNAAQAIPAGDAERHEIRVETRAEGDEVLIRVVDTGVGIAPEDLPKLFVPFYSTKPVGVGTGLGLAICGRLVKEMGGRITVESELGRGSTFTVRLPASGAASAHAQDPEAAVTPPRRGRVLVVDDDLAVATTVRRLLTAWHDIEVETLPLPALDRLRAGEDFDVILCDVMMPQMSGQDFFTALTAARPELTDRVVFVTGGAFTPEAKAFLGAVGNVRLDKPFSPTRLRTVVAERLVVLDREGAQA